MARVTVGECTACGRELRVKEGAVRPKMRLTCTCGQINDVGQDLSELNPKQRVQLLVDGLEGTDRRISSELCSREIERLAIHGSADDFQILRESIPKLCNLARREEVPGRTLLLNCLGTLGDAAAVNDLLMILQSADDSTLRTGALRSLGNIFYQNYIHPFLERAARAQLKVVRGPYAYNMPTRRSYEEYDERGHDIVSIELRGGDERIIRAIGEAATGDPRCERPPARYAHSPGTQTSSWSEFLRASKAGFSH